jgi:hypothetical protein
MALRGVGDAPACLFVDLRIAIERPTHRGLGQVEHLRQLLQVHDSIAGVKALSKTAFEAKRPKPDLIRESDGYGSEIACAAHEINAALHRDKN